MQRPRHFQTDSRRNGHRELRKVTAEIEGLQLTGDLNPASIGTAIQGQAGGSTGHQRALLNQVQQGASRQLLNAAQIAR